MKGPETVGKEGRQKGATDTELRPSRSLCPIRVTDVSNEVQFRSRINMRTKYSQSFLLTDSLSANLPTH